MYFNSYDFIILYYAYFIMHTTVKGPPADKTPEDQYLPSQ